MKALGEMFLSKEASPFPPFDERDTQIGVGLMLTEWGDEIMGVAEEIEKFEINSAREIKD